MNEIKLCRDCKFSKPDNSIGSLFGLLSSKWDYALCMHEEALEERRPDYHIGKTWKEPSRSYCSTMRKFDCGMKAKYFEKR